MRPLLLALLTAAVRLVAGFICRQGPEDSTSYCGLPVDLANFQGYYHCDNAVQIGRPKDKAELLDMVSHFERVKGVGVGHSWWKQQFCAGTNETAINIVTTEMASTLAMILDDNTSYPVVDTPASYPIQVDEAALRVSVLAGVPQRLLLNYLAEYKTASAPEGYSLPAFAWYIDQSIGGAVATGTHGSSFEYGSLSSQAARIELALANGTLANFSADASDPTIWHSVQVSVGRLGVITEIEFEIVPQRMVQRDTYTTSFDDFVDAIQTLQDEYNAAQENGPEAVASVLAAYEGTQLFWFVPTNETIWVQYSTLEADALAAFRAASPAGLAGVSISSLLESSPNATSEQGVPMPAMVPAHPHPTTIAPGPYLEDVFAQVPTPELPPNPFIAAQPLAYNDLYKAFIETLLINGSFTNRDALLAETTLINKQTSDDDPYDQYEFSFPIATAGDCLQKVSAAVYAGNLGVGFAVPPLIRFVGPELPFLANANGGPRIFFNIEDHISYQTGHVNAPFQEVASIMRYECNARMHWGKAGWDRYNSCFDGATTYGTGWCSFGCAVEELDPDGKFSSTSNVWAFTASRNNATVPFASCCGPTGFDAACDCAPRPPCTPADTD